MEVSKAQTQKTVLKFENEAPAVYDALDKLKRTGWVECGVENPESVKEHTESLIALAQELSDLLTEEETDGLVEMLEIHDWPEAIHGDEILLELDSEKRKEMKSIKFKNEKQALEKICNDLPNGEHIMNLWLRFETSYDPASVFARELDKYQAVEKALEYEESQGIALFKEFLDYSINFIHHPVLLARIEKLKLRWHK